MGAFQSFRAGALCLALLTPLTAAHAVQSPEDLVQRYHESLRMATEENDFTGATQALSGTIDEYRSEDPENPQLAALFLLRAVLQFSMYGDEAREKILDSLKQALRVHPWAQFEPTMRSERLDELLEEARQELGSEAPSRGYVVGASALRCREDLVIYAAYSPDLKVASATLHWKGELEDSFQERSMEDFSGVVFSGLSAVDHENRDGEYFITLRDESGDVLVSVGSQTTPQRISSTCAEPTAEGDEKRPRRSRRKRDESDRKGKRAKRKRRIGVRLMAGTGWGVSYGESERVYDIADPNKAGHYSLLATACAIARRAAPRNGPLPDAQALFGSDAGAPPAGSIFGKVATNQAQAASLAGVYDAERCGQMHPINSGVASSMFHLEPELSFRFSDRWEAAVFSRLQLIHGLDILAPVEGAPLDAIKPEFEALRLPMPWTVGLKARYRKDVVSVSGLSWFVGGFAGYGRAALAIPMPFGHDRNGNSVADENEVACSVAPSQSPVFPAMDGCSDPSKSASAIEELKALGKKGGKARDVLRLGQAFAGVEVGIEYMFTPVVGLSAATQVGVWFAGHRTSGLVDLKLGPSLRF